MMIRRTGADPAGLETGTARAQLRARAATLAAIRSYFAAHSVLEVTTPELLPYTSCDPQLQSFALAICGPESTSSAHTAANSSDLYFLQTSPESAMKQLLAKGSGSIYQICKAFRRDFPGRLHAIEFSMLEWYRVDFTLPQIIDDTLALVASVLPARPRQQLSYREAFMRYAGIDPFTLHGAALRDFARQKICVDFSDDSDDVWLDLLLTHLVEPHLGQGHFTVLHSYPPSQAAMALIVSDVDGREVAARFELYIDGVEIANGYQELTDADLQKQRFERDNAHRRARGLAEMAIDQPLLDALRAPGMPACAGVALGIDRLMLFV